MFNKGQQHFERVAKKFFDALRRIITKRRPALAPVRVR
jgi:hypothetical protein